jgi:2-oxoglutarate dehydrogenase E1 component
MYRKIAAMPTVRQVWATRLASRGVIDESRAGAMLDRKLAALQQKFETLDPEKQLVEPTPVVAAPGTAARASTSVPIDRLRELNGALLVVPEGFQVNRKLERPRDRRRHAFDALDERTIDWATAEEVALASILADGVPIRLTGEDTERGTFSHRHAVLRDAASGKRFSPLENLPQAKAACEIHNSPLSENGAVAFEYGYNIQAPERLVIWEAQYGDFVNGAQVMLDEFVLSARTKWGQQPSLVMLLPHAHEGQGPDHASARPERFLQLAADINMRIVNCTTAAQYFHVLRRQAALLLTDPLPLVVLTPKSLLRHPMVASAPREFADARFRLVIDDEAAAGHANLVRRLIVCTGKVYVDLAASDLRAANPQIAICRVEQLYPVPMRDLRALVAQYAAADEIVWVQEEPENMGALDFIRPYLEETAGGRPVRAIARPRSASPAEGSAARHARQQQAIVDAAFAKSLVRAKPGTTPKPEQVAG